MRGKVSLAQLLTCSVRITPAYAGKSIAFPSSPCFSGDHPRLCGEKDHNNRSRCGNTGSPPPMRGKVLFRRMGYNQRRDHPRLCGEKGRCVRHPFQFGGSPPPMRGKVIVRVVGISSRGITPAYAGKSIRPQPSKFLLRDHPRLCGEK